MVGLEDVRSFHRDGAVLLKQRLDASLVRDIASFLDKIRAGGGERLTGLRGTGVTGRTLVDQYPLLNNPDLSTLVFQSPIPGCAAALLEKNVIYHVFDQMFYKEAGRILPTTFHQDTPYLQVEGFHLLRTWICCDPSPPDATVSVVRGSHLWNVTYSSRNNRGPVEFFAEAPGQHDYPSLTSETAVDDGLPPTPDIESNRDSFDILSWDVQPGDVLAFNGNILHGSFGGIDLPHPRRALAVLWGSEDIRYRRRRVKAVPDLPDLLGASVEDGERVGDRPDVYRRYEAGVAA